MALAARPPRRASRGVMVARAASTLPRSTRASMAGPGAPGPPDARGPARPKPTPLSQPGGAGPARRGPGAVARPRPESPASLASIDSTTARNGARRRAQSHSGPFAAAARSRGIGVGRAIPARSADAPCPEAVSNWEPETRPARLPFFCAIQEASIRFAAARSLIGALSPTASLENASRRAPRRESPQEGASSSRSTPTCSRSSDPRDSGATVGEYVPALARRARTPAAFSTEISISADAGTTTAARRRASKLLGNLRPRALGGEGEHLRLLAGPAGHGAAHVPVAQHQGGEERRERGPDGPARVICQEEPDDARRRGEEIPVPEERPDAGAERERERVREQEEHHPALARDGQHVLLRFGHGGAA